MFSRNLCVSLLTSVVAVALSALPGYGQNPQIEALYVGADPKGDFSFTWKEQKPGTFTKTVGRLRWEVPASEFSTGGMDRSFSGYCSEPLVPIVAGNLYRYEIQSPEMPDVYGLPNTDDGRKEANRRAAYVRELFARYYLSSLTPDEPTASLAFQAALWEIINESQFPNVPAPFSLFTGNFLANYPNLAQSPAYVQQAQQYLLSLTGNDTLFYDNPNLTGRELVFMRGLLSANGLVAQSQFGLRTIGGGGVPGLNGATANGGLGGGPLLGGGGGGGGGGGFPFLGFGFPGGFGNGGGGSTGGGTGSTGSSGVPSSAPSTPSSSTGGPSNTPPNTSGNGPPNTPPENAVPAPPAVVLGLIAVGLFAGRRALTRFQSKK